MKSLAQWLDEYGESHQNPTNKIIHKVCVPAIMFSLFGLLWAIPTPEVFGSAWVNWATLFYLACLGFYLTIDIKYALMMAVVAGLMLVGVNFMATTPFLVSGSIVIFVVSWAGQFYGHKVEGKKPSFLQDLQFLLIGPLWVANDLLSR